MGKSKYIVYLRKKRFTVVHIGYRPQVKKTLGLKDAN